jgi:uncharacterized protein YgiB involved in biofilm formation
VWHGDKTGKDEEDDNEDEVECSSLVGTLRLDRGMQSAVTAAGAKAWGTNTYGQLGNGIFGGESSTAVVVSNLSNVIAIRGGYTHSVALRSDGTVWTWGANGQS